eukprot:GHVU01150882.1.p1 GENE.GHVU01150882.1~~GHVU01150882.1.p1  ORF type:complete len:117 (-),score=31.58 GHVU01150882.1:182-532(-)
MTDIRTYVCVQMRRLIGGGGPHTHFLHRFPVRGSTRLPLQQNDGAPNNDELYLNGDPAALWRSMESAAALRSSPPPQSSSSSSLSSSSSSSCLLMVRGTLWWPPGASSHESESVSR